MNQPKQLEDLSNEIFFEIFDYFHAVDLCISFTSLNQRITSILHTIPLRVVIGRSHSRRQIDLLSSYLQFQAHQVISLKISDRIFDDHSAIRVFFHRHKFINLRFCSFTCIDHSNKFCHVIEQIKSLDKLVAFTINQTLPNKLDDKLIHRLFEPILLHQSPYLRSVVLGMGYDYGYLSKYSSISPNLRSLQIHIISSQSISPFHLVPSILCLCHSLQNFDLTLECEEQFTNDFGRYILSEQRIPHLFSVFQPHKSS